MTIPRPLLLAAALLLAARSAAPAEDLRFDLPVMASWTASPSNSVTLAWERPEAAPATLSWVSLDAPGAVPCVLDLPPARRHVVPLADLLPATTYAYTVSDATGPVRSGRFRTAPATPDVPFRFVFWTDLQGGLDPGAARTVADAVAARAPDFVTSAGDLSDYRYASDYPAAVDSWRQFFSIASNLLAVSVFEPVTGNHDEPENPDSLWFRMMELPGNERSYVFDVGPIRFIGIDNAEFEVPARVPWLARQLQAAAADPAVRFVIPITHRPPHSWGERGGQGNVREWFCPLFTRYEASLVLSGHAHTYQRTKPIDGVPYLVSGGAGGRLYPVDPSRPEIAFATSCFHFVEFEWKPSENALFLTARDAAGNPFDTAAYTPFRAVRFSPPFPRRGETCTITYDPSRGPLADEPEIFLHLGRDEFRHVHSTNPMTRQPDGTYTATFTVPSTPKWNLAFCFCTPDKKRWDNNHALNWQILLQPDFPASPPAP